MAKKSKIAKNEKRKEIVARYAERRQELKAIIKNPMFPMRSVSKPSSN